MRFIDPNRLTATGMSKPVGRSNSSAGPPPGVFDTRSVTARDLEVRAHRLPDQRQLVLAGERADEFVQILEHDRLVSRRFHTSRSQKIKITQSQEFGFSALCVIS